MWAFIWIFNVVALTRSGDAWLGLFYFLIFLIPASTVAVLMLKRKKVTSGLSLDERLRHFMFALQGVVLACWSYDLATTHYAIDVARLATEINPLGWPLGILGALAYYGPTLVMMYVLLFRIKQKLSLYAGVVLSAVALFMGSMNFNAGASNFQVFLATAYIMPEIRLNLLVLLVIVDIISILAVGRFYGKHMLPVHKKLNFWKSFSNR
ncbi:MAG: hypothetical protein N3D85_01505 [Candidatus Bathyarchaeota archaeon]|nr:hypothetical protein [Candidatus Bathyarchaeota archaeon]